MAGYVLATDKKLREKAAGTLDFYLHGRAPTLEKETLREQLGGGRRGGANKVLLETTRTTINA